MAVNVRERFIFWVNPVLHPQSERQLSGGNAYRKVTTATGAYAFTGSDATDAALAASGASGPPQSNASRSLCILRHCRKHSGTPEGPSCRGVLLAQNAEQPELERHGLVEAIPADQGTVPSTATQVASPLRGAASSSHTAVNQLLKSVVRKNCTLRSVGAGDGRPPRPPGGEFRGATANLSGHETGNGGNSQGEPTANRNLLYSEIRRHDLPEVVP